MPEIAYQTNVRLQSLTLLFYLPDRRQFKRVQGVVDVDDIHRGNVCGCLGETWDRGIG